MKKRLIWTAGILLITAVAFAASTRTNITWQIWQGGAYATELNLDATALFPETDDGVDLGSTGQRFADGYFGDDVDIEGDLNADGDGTVGGTFEVTGVLTATGGVARTSQEFIVTGGGRPGASNGWLTTGGAVNLFNYTLPASEATTATMVIPVAGLKVGWTITSWKLVGQIESAGGIVELDGDLRRLVATVGANADTSVGAITPVHVVADTILAVEKTGLTEVVAADESFYVLLSGTTAGSTDIDIMSITVTVTTN